MTVNKRKENERKTSHWKKGHGFLMPEKINAGESETMKTERQIKR